MSPLLRPIAGSLLALAAGMAFAQAPAPLVVPDAADATPTALPLVDEDSGRVEAFLLIEPGNGGRATRALDRLLERDRSPSLGAGLVIPMDNGRRASASLSLEPSPTLGLLCNNSALARSVGSMAQHCLVARLGGSATGAVPTPLLPQAGARAEVRLDGQGGGVTASLGLGRYTLDSPLQLPGASDGAGRLMLSLQGLQVEQQDISLGGDLALGNEVWLSIGGTLARARVVPATSVLPGAVAPEWNTGTVTLGGGVGDFGGEIVGRVIDVPGADSRYSNLGLGLTWRAPWRARVTVGAENLVSRGKNPFAGSEEEEDSGRVPYIRYEQDL